MPKLAGGDQQTGCRNETRDHRMRQEIGQKTEPKDPHKHQHATGEESEHGGGGQIIHRSFGRNFADCGGRHEGDDGDRPHCKRPAGPENRISDQWQDRGIESDLRRQAGKHGISQRLRDQHDGHNNRRQKVAGQRGDIVYLAPSQSRKDFREFGHRLNAGERMERVGAVGIGLGRPRPARTVGG